MKMLVRKLEFLIYKMPRNLPLWINKLFAIDTTHEVEMAYWNTDHPDQLVTLQIIAYIESVQFQKYLKQENPF